MFHMNQKMALLALFLDASQQTFQKPACAKYGRNFFHRKKFHKSQLSLFFQRCPGHIFTI